MTTRSALLVHARLLNDPPLWAVGVRAGRTKEILWSSWTDEWSAYPTIEDAVLRADDIVRRLGGPQSLSSVA